MRLFHILNLALLMVFFVDEGHIFAQQQGEDTKVNFSRDIRPILSNHCFACHGPDENARQAGLRLDRKGDIDFDELLDRISSDDEDFIMPPPTHNKPLSIEQKRQLAQWIKDGGHFEKHWSFVPPQKTKTPDLSLIHI